MSKSILTPLLAAIVFSGTLELHSAEAEESLGILPGSICQPIDDLSITAFLRNSGGTIANLSGEELSDAENPESPGHSAQIQCPIRMPDAVAPGETLEWSAYFLSNNTGECLLRIAALDGELLGTISGYPVPVDGPAPGQSFWRIQLSAPIGDYGVPLIASARCDLPPVSNTHGVAGLTTFRARIF